MKDISVCQVFFLFLGFVELLPTLSMVVNHVTIKNSGDGVFDYLCYVDVITKECSLFIVYKKSRSQSVFDFRSYSGPGV